MYESVLAKSLSIESLERELAELESEIGVTAGMVDDCIHENATVDMDQDEYQVRYHALVDRFNHAKARYADVAEKIRRP